MCFSIKTQDLATIKAPFDHLFLVAAMVKLRSASKLAPQHRKLGINTVRGWGEGDMVLGHLGVFTQPHLFLFETLLRSLVKSMLKRVDIPKVKKTMEFLPGGDIRLKDNLWVRAAFRDSGLRRVPREGQIREVFFKIVKKKDWFPA